MTGATDVDGTLMISTGTYNADGAQMISGTLSITGTGVYDADNTFTAASGNVTFTGGFLSVIILYRLRYFKYRSRNG